MFAAIAEKFRMGKEGLKISMKFLDEIEKEIEKFNLKERISQQ